MSEVKNATTKFINDLREFLKEDKCDEALKLFEDKRHENIITESSWDIVPIVSSFLTAENKSRSKELIDCCEAILNVIAETCNPSEIVLELLEQVECLEDDVKFCGILRALSKSINRTVDKTRAIEWCISTIRSYVDGLPLPEREKSKEIETDASFDITITVRIETVYASIISFLEPLVEEASLGNKDSKKSRTLRYYVSSVLIFLLGKPLCYLEEQRPMSESKQCMSEKIINLIASVTGDLLWFLTIISKRSIKDDYKQNANTDEKNCNLKVTLFESKENVSDLAYANLYYNVLIKPSLWVKVPQVYHPQYIFQACIYLVEKLLNEQGSSTIAKGLDLIDQLLKRLKRRTLTSEMLELSIFSDLFNSIAKVMIYCNTDKERKKALQIFQEYLEMFDMQARYFIILQLYQISEHSGLLSLITGILKESIIECLQTTPPAPYFIGYNLQCLIKQACKLPHGSTSDLVELLDEIISSLNLLRFLFIRDKHNVTGIWNMVDKLENNYLKPLRDGIHFCKAHWKVKIKDLEEQKRIHAKKYDSIELEKSNTEITLTVGGERLPAMPLQEKIAFCYQAVNGLDVMESILIRVNECAANNPFNCRNKVQV